MKKTLVKNFMDTPAGKTTSTWLEQSKLSVEVLYEMVYAKVGAIQSYLEAGRKYTISSLFSGDKKWLLWDKKTRCAAGMCLAHLVEVKALTLEAHVATKGKGQCKYFVPVKKTSD